jgi:redox-sensitive bicupin YhaK (pirin superfamily)
MAQVREIRRIVTGSTTRDGAGVKLVRVIGRSDVEEFDPFLLLDAFDSTDPAEYTMGFPWHPHRGIETVTYLLHGDIEHSDSLGNSGHILDGSCQWMTAGSGILHQEMPQATPRLLGVQLWINLPRQDKMTTPQYRDLLPTQIPQVQGEGSTTRVVAGHYRGVQGATQGDYVRALLLDVGVQPGAEWRLEADPQATLFVYLLAGEGRFGGAAEALGARHAALFGPGEAFVATATSEGLRFLLIAARPLGEPIAWAGPIVMNTREELRQAQADLAAGTFVRTPPIG